MVDYIDDANMIHFVSRRCRGVRGSVMARELHELVLGFDHAFAIFDLLAKILGRKIEIEALVDSKTVFDVVAKNGRTQEKRLQI